MNMKRLFDILMASGLLILLWIPMVMIAVLVKLTSKGPALYWSDRVGINNRIFKMPKYRTMKNDAPVVATHLLTNPEQHVTLFGKFLRKTSLDELPQLLTILKGDMSFVGPRPALFNQYDLIEMRTTRGIHTIIPGLTGWAQINGRDTLPIPQKVDLDDYYYQNRSFQIDMKILVLTIRKVIKHEGVQH